MEFIVEPASQRAIIHAVLLSEPTELLSMTLQHADDKPKTLDEVVSITRGSVWMCLRHLYQLFYMERPFSSRGLSVYLELLGAIHCLSCQSE